MRIGGGGERIEEEKSGGRVGRWDGAKGGGHRQSVAVHTVLYSLSLSIYLSYRLSRTSFMRLILIKYVFLSRGCPQVFMFCSFRSFLRFFISCFSSPL